MAKSQESRRSSSSNSLWCRCLVCCVGRRIDCGDDGPPPSSPSYHRYEDLEAAQWMAGQQSQLDELLENSRRIIQQVEQISSTMRAYTAYKRPAPMPVLHLTPGLQRMIKRSVPPTQPPDIKKRLVAGPATL